VRKDGIMAKEIKRIDIKEFREEGYLQELNRQFLHPLGLALEVIINDETGEETLGGVWDYREDLEGMYYALDNPSFTSNARLAGFIKRYRNISKLQKVRKICREISLGFWIEPVPNEIKKEN